MHLCEHQPSYCSFIHMDGLLEQLSARFPFLVAAAESTMDKDFRVRGTDTTLSW